VTGFITLLAAGGLGGFILFLLLFGGGLYFTPLLIAIVRKKSNVVAIGALNTLLGWSLIGWVVALVWALSKDQSPTVIVQNVIPPQGGLS
jgi:hypothetical protein